MRGYTDAQGDPEIIPGDWFAQEHAHWRVVVADDQQESHVVRGSRRSDNSPATERGGQTPAQR